MPPPAERTSTSTQLLTIHGAGGVWGIPSTAVASIEPPPVDATATPLELLALLGVAVSAPANQRARVLVLEVEGERVNLLVHGALELAETAAADLLQLPAAVRAMTPLLSHLAVLDGKPALLVISPERLLQAARGAPSAVPLPDSARGSSC
jgi:hypothetical protein